MRRAAKVDDNQSGIIATLRMLGASVEVISEPVDLAVGYCGVTVLAEVKDGAKSPSRQAHTAQQAKFFREWRGSAVTLTSTADCIGLINVMRKRAVTMMGIE